MSKKQREPGERNETLATLLMPVYEKKLEKSLGSRLHELRRQQGLSLRALAEKSGLSANTLSLIENGKTSPSVTTLQQISLALGISITSFFETEAQNDSVIYTQHEQRASSSFAHGSLEELGSGLGNEGLQPMEVTIKPHGNSGTQALTHDGVEFIYCLAGEMHYKVDDHAYVLHGGDTLMFNSQLPHTWHNMSDEDARLLIVLTILEESKPKRPVNRIQQDYL